MLSHDSSSVRRPVRLSSGWLCSNTATENIYTTTFDEQISDIVYTVETASSLSRLVSFAPANLPP